MENKGHEIAETLQKLSLDVLLGDLNRTALSTLLEDLANQTKVFADAFELVVNHAQKRSVEAAVNTDLDRELEFNP